MKKCEQSHPVPRKKGKLWIQGDTTKNQKTRKPKKTQQSNCTEVREDIRGSRREPVNMDEKVAIKIGGRGVFTASGGGGLGLGRSLIRTSIARGEGGMNTVGNTEENKRG